MITILFTGLSGSGKTTTATLLKEKLEEQGKMVYILDGDIVRKGLCSDLSFSPKDRKENIRRISHLMILLNKLGYIVLSTFISPFKEDRDSIRTLHDEENLLYKECYVSTDIETCINQDVKGLYKKAKNGEIPNFTGLTSPYEVPTNPDFKINQKNTVEENVNLVLLPLFNNIIELTKLDMEWLQVIEEGWCDPLKGFMKEKDYLSCLHFSHIKRNDKYYNQSVPIILSSKFPIVW